MVLQCRSVGQTDGDRLGRSEVGSSAFPGSETRSRPSGGTQEIFFTSSHVMFPRSLQIMSFDLGQKRL